MEIDDVKNFKPLEVVKQYPPNFDLIKTALPLASAKHTYCYDGRIFSPDGHEVPLDINYHESIHVEQQGDDSHGWWIHYLTSKEFRFKQELEAYGRQFAFARASIIGADEEARLDGKHLAAGSTNLIRWALEGMAHELAGPAYGHMIGLAEAESKIRNYAR